MARQLERDGSEEKGERSAGIDILEIFDRTLFFWVFFLPAFLSADKNHDAKSGAGVKTIIMT